MREFYNIIVNPFIAGLRRDRHPSIAKEPFLYTVRNLKPTENGLVAPTVVTNPFTTFKISYPNPRLFQLKSYNIIADKDAIYTFRDDTYTPTLVYAIPTSIRTEALWTVADAFDAVLLCNSKYLFLMTKSGVSQYTAIGNCGCVAAHPSGGQIMVGDLTSSWNGCGPNFVAWSDIGNLSFDVSGSPASGFAPMPVGRVQNILPLNNYFIVYGNKGLVFLEHHANPAVTWGIARQYPIGIMARGAVGGDLDQHVFVDTVGNIWSVNVDGPKKLGFSEFFSAVESDIIVSYDPVEMEYYVSSHSSAYILTPAGLGHTDRPITSCARYDDLLVGIAGEAPPDGYHAFAVDDINMSANSLKTLTAVEFAGTIDVDCFCAVEVLPSHGGPWIQSAWKPLNKNRWTVPYVTGSSFRIHFKTKSESDKIAVQAMTYRWKFSDKRLIRGAYNNASP